MNTAAATKAKPATTQILTPPATLCFPNLFTPRAPSVAGEPRFSCILLFDKAQQEMPAYKNLRQGVFTVIQDKYGPRAKDMLKQLRLPFRDAGEKEYNGFEPGMTYINPWLDPQYGKPQIIDRNGDDVTVPGDVFAGQLVRAAVRPFCYDTNGNKGVSFGLHSIQIIEADRPRLDGRRSARDVFNDGAYGPTAEDQDDVPF